MSLKKLTAFFPLQTKTSVWLQQSVELQQSGQIVQATRINILGKVFRHLDRRVDLLRFDFTILATFSGNIRQICRASVAVANSPLPPLHTPLQCPATKYSSIVKGILTSE